MVSQQSIGFGVTLNNVQYCTISVVSHRRLYSTIGSRAVSLVRRECIGSGETLKVTLMVVQ